MFMRQKGEIAAKTDTSKISWRPMRNLRFSCFIFIGVEGSVEETIRLRRKKFVQNHILKNVRRSKLDKYELTAEDGHDISHTKKRVRSSGDVSLRWRVK